MKKQGKKSNWILIAVAAAALLSLVAIAYAQESGKRYMSNNNMANMMGGNSMDAMHKQMTKNLDPKTREQMDKMHESCRKEMKEGKKMLQMSRE